MVEKNIPKSKIAEIDIAEPSVFEEQSSFPFKKEDNNNQDSKNNINSDSQYRKKVKNIPTAK